MSAPSTENDEKSQQMQRFLDVAQKAAIEAGEHLLKRLGQAKVIEKKPGDFVTQADFESQQIIHDLIKANYPDHSFLGEEGEAADQIRTSDYQWIVDPIDGTNNFIHQLPSFCISIGLRFSQEMIVGCVHDPVLKETYTAIKGQGAFLNGQQIHPRQSAQMKGSIVICSLPRDLNRESHELIRLVQVLCDSETTLRRLGSAALNLCYVASGRADSYWSSFAKIWDIAAGYLILHEAGGLMTDLKGDSIDWEDIRFVASSNTEFNDQMISLLTVEST